MMKSPYLHPVQPLHIHPDVVALVFLWYVSVIWSMILTNILCKKNQVSSPTSVLFRLLSQVDQPEIQVPRALKAISLICRLWWSFPSSGRESMWVFCGTDVLCPGRWGGACLQVGRNGWIWGGSGSAGPWWLLHAWPGAKFTTACIQELVAVMGCYYLKIDSIQCSTSNWKLYRTSVS